MNNRASAFQYFDLFFFTALAVISEIMSNALLGVWDSSFYFSFSIVLCLIAMIRWGAVGVVAGAAGGLPGIWFSDMPLAGGVMFYGAANLFLVIPVLLYGRRSRDVIVQNPVFLSAYVLVSHGCLAAGKGLVIWLLTGETTGMTDYFGATFLILVINIIICLVLRTRDGLICDMRYYFAEGEEDERHKN